MNNINVVVMNREKAKRFSFKPHDFKTAMISITDVDKDTNKIQIASNNVFAVLHLKFDDVEKGGINCITENDAIKIANFVNTVKNLTDCIVVHCEAGVSRSAGVAAAIMKYLNDDDMPIFDNPSYCPNSTCYRMTLNALMGSFNEEEVTQKEKHQLGLWAEEHISN